MPATALGVIAGAVLVKGQAEWASVFTLLASLRTGLRSFLRPNERAAMLPDSFGSSVVDHDVNHNALIPDGAAF